MTTKKLTKNREKDSKIIFGQLLDYTKKLRIFLAQNCLKRIMSQLLEYTKK